MIESLVEDPEVRIALERLRAHGDPEEALARVAWFSPSRVTASPWP